MQLAGPALEIRPVISKAVVVCLALAAAPWLMGGQEPLGRVLSGFALLLGVLLLWRQPAAPTLKRGPLLAVYGAFMLLAVLSLLWTANRYSTALWISEWVMAGVAFKLALSVSSSAVGRKWLIGAYLASAAVFSVSAIWMYLTSDYGRLTGTFYWANPAAAYLMPAILVCLEGVRRSAGRVGYGWIAGAVGFAATFLLTDSRAALAVLALVVVLYLGLVKLSKRFCIKLLFIVLMAWGLSFGLVNISSITSFSSEKSAPGSRLTEALSGGSSSGSDRLYYLGSVGQMWEDNPLVGVGAGAYGDVHPSYQGRVVSASANAHNVYAQVLAELGLVGALLLLSLLMILAFGILRGLIRKPEQVALAVGTFGLLMHFGLDIDASYPSLLMLVGMLLGVIYTQSSVKWVNPPVLTPLIAIAVLVPVESAYLSFNLAERGKFEQEEGSYAAAADLYGQASNQLVHNPDYVSSEGINWYAMSVESPDDAKSHLQRALELARRAQQEDRYDSQHHQLEGRILRQQGDVAGAGAAFENALRLDSFNHPDYALDLAKVQAERGQVGAARETIRKMLDQYPPAVVANRNADQSLKFKLAQLKVLLRQLETAETIQGGSGASR